MGDTGGMARDVWREYRKHISEYEAKSTELGLDLQQESKALQLAKEELNKVQRETADLRNMKESCAKGMYEQHMKLMELSKQREEVAADTARLTQQLNAARDKLEQEKKQQEAKKHDQEAHLQDMRTQLSSLQQYLQDKGLQAPTAAAALIGSQPVTQPEPHDASQLGLGSAEAPLDIQTSLQEAGAAVPVESTAADILPTVAH